MITEVIMPKMSNTMLEGQLIKWYKKEGEYINQNETIMEILTDKVNMEVDSPASGFIRKIFIHEGEVAPIGKVVALLTDKADEQIPEKYLVGNPTEPVREKKDVEIKISPRARKLISDNNLDISQIPNENGVISEQNVKDYLSKREINATPVAKKIAAENNIPLGEIEGSGINMLITRADVENHIAHKIEKREYTSKPFTGVRRIIADRLSKSKFTAPHLYFCVEVDMKKAMDFKDRINDLKKDENVKVNINHLIIMATTRALGAYKEINSSIIGDEILTYNNVNIGIATDTPQGLMVPVLKGAQKMTLQEIAEKSKDLIDKARVGKISPDDLKNGTFTISNLGMYDVEFFTAIINPPESAILAVSSIKNKPAVVEGNVVVRPLMKLVLSVDHRLIDGVLGVKFLNKIKSYLENPELLCL